MRWESRYANTQVPYSPMVLCVFDGEVLWACLHDKKGHVTVCSATRDEVAAANARRPAGPPGPFGGLDPASELELWASCFQLNRVAIGDDRGVRCFIVSGGAGPWFRTPNELESDAMVAAARARLHGADSIRIRIRCDNLWLRRIDIRDRNGERVRSTRYGDADLAPHFDATTFTFQRPANAEDVQFFPKGP